MIVGKRYVAARTARRLLRVSDSTLTTWAGDRPQRTGARKKAGCPWLHGAAIQFTWETCNVRGLRVRFYLLSDLEKVLDAQSRINATDGSSPADKHLSKGLHGGAIADRLKLRTKAQRAALYQLLKHWRTSGALVALDGEILARKGQRREVPLYQFDEVQRLLAGRDVKKLAKELTRKGTIGKAEPPQRNDRPEGSEPKGRQGRPKGSFDEKAAERNENMRRDWKANRYSSKAALARAYHVSRSHASNIIDGRE